MKLNKNEKIILNKYFSSIIICICSFISEEEIKIYVEKSETIPELLGHISHALKTKEAEGWEGDDLKEEQLNVLTIISELYLKRNKSKYKIIEKPSEIISWFCLLISAHPEMKV
jgi:hypothetical protein